MQKNIRTTFTAVATSLTATLALTSSAIAAPGGTVSAPLQVKADVQANCTIATPNTLNFGTYNTLTGAALNGQADIQVACTAGSSATITLGQGITPASGSTAAAPLRQLVNGGSRLRYDLFTDAARSFKWGDTAGTGALFIGSGPTVALVTVFGTILGSQSGIAGSYADTVTATITF